jgi:hypothetical protein
MMIVDDPNKPKTEPTNTERQVLEQRSFYLTGLVLVVVGIFFFLDRATDFDLPFPIISWEFILIIAGIYIGEKSNFSGLSWIACMAIGAYFLFDDFFPHFDLRFYFGPILLIALGIYFIAGPKSFRYKRRNRHNYDRYGRRMQTREQGFASENSLSEDYIDIVAIFGGVQKNVTTKQFKGGEAVSIFGGTEVNLMQADFEGKVILELTQIFGGCTLIVPPHWDLKTELVSIFGGTEDNRPTHNVVTDSKKVVILKGTSIFGGIEIKSY